MNTRTKIGSYAVSTATCLFLMFAAVQVPPATAEPQADDAIALAGDMSTIPKTSLKTFPERERHGVKAVQERRVLLAQAAKQGPVERKPHVDQKEQPAAQSTEKPHRPGMVNVTLHIYSGRPDPEWQLTVDQAKELMQRTRGLQAKGLGKPAAPPAQLGYRGISIEGLPESEHEKGYLYIYSPSSDLGRLQAKGADEYKQLESWLLGTGGCSVPSEVKSTVQDFVSKGVTPTPPPPEETGGEPDDGAKSLTEKSPQSDLVPKSIAYAAPRFNPNWWNGPDRTRRCNNCYNYANNVATYTFAQPGLACRRPCRSFTCAEVIRASECDGLKLLRLQRRTASGGSRPVAKAPAAHSGHIVALVVRPGADFHWYRLDANGTWSHKPGQTPAINYDNSRQRIADPRKCDRGPYTEFCGFFAAIRSSVRLAGGKKNCR